MKIEILFPEFCNLFGDISNMKYLRKCLPNEEYIETSIEDWKEIDYESDFNYIPLMNELEEIEGLNKIIIDKQSILDTINQIE